MQAPLTSMVCPSTVIAGGMELQLLTSIGATIVIAV